MWTSTSPATRVPSASGIFLAVGQRGHPADAVPDEHRGAVAREREHGVEVRREVFEPVVIVVRLLRQAQPRLVPDDQPEPLGQVAFLVVPLRTVGAPAVRPDDGRRVGRPVAFDPQLAAVGPADHVYLARPLPRRILIRLGNNLHTSALLLTPGLLLPASLALRLPAAHPRLARIGRGGRICARPEREHREPVPDQASTGRPDQQGQCGGQLERRRVPAGIEPEDAAARYGDGGGGWAALLARREIVCTHLVRRNRDRGLLDDVRVVVPPIEQVDPPGEDRDGEQPPEPHSQDVERHEEHGAGSIQRSSLVSCG